MLMILNSLLFWSANHPLMMITLLISQTLLISFTMTKMFWSSWLALILILIMLGGILILFIYIASLAPNEKFPISKYPFLLLPLMILPPYLTPMKLTPNFSILFSLPSMLNTIILALYLFLTLIIVVNMTISISAPLRTN